MTMDTLKAVEMMEDAGLDRKKATAIAKAIKEVGRHDLVTRADLWQHTVAIIASFIGVASVFKIFG